MARLASPRSLQLRRILGGLGGAAAGYGLARELPLLPSALLCALLLATAGDLSRRLADAGHWWGLIGAASGCLIGAASVLAAALQHPTAGDQLPQRAATLLLLAMAGAIAWLHSGLDPARTFSSRLSTSLTIVVTAVVGPGWVGHLMHSHNGGADAG